MIARPWRDACPLIPGPCFCAASRSTSGRRVRGSWSCYRNWRG